jgi:Mg-chelatase subunit ChlD
VKPVADWIRRSFTAAGLTQIPPGPHIGALQNRYGGGVVMLCIDVSGSMDGRPIREAVRGAKEFVTEATEARYKVGVMLWNTQVTGLAEPAADGRGAMKLLDRTHSAAGGNNLIGPLDRCHQILDQFKDAPDRVVALFGDGDLTPKVPVLRKVAQMKAENIRFVTRGLGRQAAAEFGEISSEEPSSAAIDDVAKLADGIAAMAASLKKNRRPG